MTNSAERPINLPDTVSNPESEAKEYLLFGPVGRHLYPEYAQKQIEEKFGPSGSEADRKARAEMWKNYSELSAQIEALPADSNTDMLGFIEDFIKGLGDFQRKQLEETPPKGLGYHLREVTRVARDLVLSQADAMSIMPSIINHHDARLFAYVITPLHDLLKFLGAMNSQVMPDHEVMTAALVRKHFANRKVRLGDERRVYKWAHKPDLPTEDWYLDPAYRAGSGKFEYGTTTPFIKPPGSDGRPYHDGDLVTLSVDDASFIADVIEDHENINKETNRSDYIRSNDKATRAKALFFMVDVMGFGLNVGGVAFSDEVSVDRTIVANLEMLKERFADLYLRHIDQIEGKIYRPEWVLFTIQDILNTIATLVEQENFEFPTSREGDKDPSNQDVPRTLIRMAIEVIDKVAIASAYQKQLNAIIDGLAAPTEAENDENKKKLVLKRLVRLETALKDDENAKDLVQLRKRVTEAIAALTANPNDTLTTFKVKTLSDEQIAETVDVKAQLFVLKKPVSEYVKTKKLIMTLEGHKENYEEELAQTRVMETSRDSLSEREFTRGLEDFAHSLIRETDRYYQLKNPEIHDALNLTLAKILWSFESNYYEIGHIRDLRKIMREELQAAGVDISNLSSHPERSGFVKLRPVQQKRDIEESYVGVMNAAIEYLKAKPVPSFEV